MKAQDQNETLLDPSRRRLLAAAGISAGSLLVPLPCGAEEKTAPWARDAGAADPVATPPLAGLHLQFGADASREMVVSWHTLQPVKQPRVLIGRPDGNLEKTVSASEAHYVDGKSKQTVYAYHATITGLHADSAYLYAALHEGAEPQFGTFRTAPSGRYALRFTSFGDQGTPTLGKLFTPPAGVTLHRPSSTSPTILARPPRATRRWGSSGCVRCSTCSMAICVMPTSSQDRVRTWWDFWNNNTRSARNRPWMPSPGNHENELGNGPIGYQAYQTYFTATAARRRADRPDARPVVCLHGGVGARGRHCQRRRVLPGRWRQLCARLFERSAKGMARERTGRCPCRQIDKIG